MADKKISDFSPSSTLTGAEKIPFAKPGANGYVTADDLRKYVTGGIDLSEAYDDTELREKIGALETQVSDNANSIASNLETITTNQATIAENQARIDANMEAINANAESRREHEANAWSIITANTAKTKENEDALALKANAADVYTKEQSDERLAEGIGKVVIPTFDDSVINARLDVLEARPEHTQFDNSENENRIAALEAYRHSEFITAEDLPSLTPYATIEFVQEELTKLVGADSTTIERLEALSQILDTTDDNILGAVSEMLNGYFTKEEVKELFVDKQTHDDDNWAKKEWCSENFLTSTDAANTYAPKADYLTEHQPLDAYLGKVEAAEAYQAKGNYAVKEDLESLATKEEIPTLEEYTEAEIRAMFEDEVELINEEAE